MLKFANLQHFPLASFARSYRVNDEALKAESMGWPIFLYYECFSMLLRDLNLILCSKYCAFKYMERLLRPSITHCVEFIYIYGTFLEHSPLN